MAKEKRFKAGLPKVIPVNNWEAADELVRMIGQAQAAINAATDSATADINKIKATLAGEVKNLRGTIDLYVRSIETFSNAHPESFKVKRSCKLTFGVLGWRKSTSISIGKKTLDLIKQVFGRRAANFIHVKETVDKEALSKLKDEELASVGARRKVKDDFYAEPFTGDVGDNVG